MPTSVEQWVGLGTAIFFAVLNAFISWQNKQHLVVLKEQTNSLTAGLVARSGAAGFQSGVSAAVVNPQAAQTEASAGTKAILDLGMQTALDAQAKKAKE